MANKVNKVCLNNFLNINLKKTYLIIHFLLKKLKARPSNIMT